MKKFNLLVFILLGATLISSCEDDFLDQVPTEDVAASTATETTGNLNLVVNGLHRSLYIRYGAQGRTGIGCLMIQMENLGEDYVNTGRANNWFITTSAWQDHINANSANNLFPYRAYYRIMRNANTIIAGAENAEGTQEEKDAAVGQALTYRAWCHFQMVQLYGQRYVPGGGNSQLGIPIRLTPSNEPLARNTVEEVYTQVNQDLDDAIAIFGDYVRPNNSNLDANVARGLRARVALVQGNYSVAADFAAQAKADFELMDADRYFNNFSDFANPEWMWGSFIQEDQTDVFGNYGAWVSRNFSSSNIRGNPKAISSLLYDQISDTDVRKSLFDPTGEHPVLPAGVEISSRHSRQPFTNQKFIAAGEGDSRMDTPYMRAAEMFLIEAEALSFIDEGAAAQVLFDLVSTRDSGYTLSTNTGQALKEEIYLQRRIELWGEGFRFYDLKRLDLPLDRTGSNHNANLISDLFTVPAGDPRWQWAIPQDALNANPLLEPNL